MPLAAQGGDGLVATVVLVWRLQVKAPHQVTTALREEGLVLSSEEGAALGGSCENEEQNRPSCSWKSCSEHREGIPLN